MTLKNNLVDLHTHSVYSGHGEGTPYEIAKQAYDLGLSTLAFTEHMPVPTNLDPTLSASLDPKNVDAYLNQIHDAQNKFPELEIIVGFECDWFEGCKKYFDLYKQNATFFIGSIHFLEGTPFDNPEDTSIWDEYGKDGIWRMYLESWREMAASNIPYSTFGHFDLPKKFGWYPSFDLLPEFKLCAEVARDNSRKIEINTSGLWKYGLQEPFPSLEALKIFNEFEVPITIGSDGHSPAQIGLSLKEGLDFAKKAGYTAIDIPKNDGSWKQVSIDELK